jgi:hypothetical protein
MLIGAGDAFQVAPDVLMPALERLAIFLHNALLFFD